MATGNWRGPGLDWSDQTIVNSLGGAIVDGLTVLYSNPDSEAYVVVEWVNYILGTNVTTMEFGWLSKDTLTFVPLISLVASWQGTGMFQWDSTVKGYDFATRLNSAGDSPDNQTACSGILVR